MDNPRGEPERPAQPPRAPGRRGRWAVVLALTGLSAGGLWAVGRWHSRRPPADVPPPADSPFLNTRPGVKYVGDDRCGECHMKEALSYREHPMGRSVSPATRLLPGQRQAT